MINKEIRKIISNFPIFKNNPTESLNNISIFDFSFRFQYK